MTPYLLVGHKSSPILENPENVTADGYWSSQISVIAIDSIP